MTTPTNPAFFEGTSPFRLPSCRSGDRGFESRRGTHRYWTGYGTKRSPTHSASFVPGRLHLPSTNVTELERRGSPRPQRPGSWRQPERGTKRVRPFQFSLLARDQQSRHPLGRWDHLQDTHPRQPATTDAPLVSGGSGESGTPHVGHRSAGSRGWRRTARRSQAGPERGRSAVLVPESGLVARPGSSPARPPLPPRRPRSSAGTAGREYAEHRAARARTRMGVIDPPGGVFFSRRFFRTDASAEFLACTDPPTRNLSRKMLPGSRRRGGSAWSAGPGADGTGPRGCGNS
jgi:hypothetical protein